MRIRRFITFGTFPFPNMALWQDLDPAAWPDNALIDHAGLRTLLGAVSGGGGAIAGADYPLDDPSFASRLPPTILPADASQHSALIDVLDGHNMVIDGPPGTGKSQTITNMIAAALAKGKRVLFLAEKRAALDVVGVRLRDSGFEPLMLELHSDRAKKTEVLNGLAKRLEWRGKKPAVALGNAAQLIWRSATRFVSIKTLFSVEVGRLGRTVNDLIWRYMNLREALKLDLSTGLSKRRLEGATDVTADDLKAARDTLDEVEAAARQVSNQDDPDFTPSCWITAPGTFLPNRSARKGFATSSRESSMLCAIAFPQPIAFKDATGVAFPLCYADAGKWIDAIDRLPDLVPPIRHRN